MPKRGRAGATPLAGRQGPRIRRRRKVVCICHGCQGRRVDPRTAKKHMKERDVSNTLNTDEGTFGLCIYCPMPRLFSSTDLSPPSWLEPASTICLCLIHSTKPSGTKASKACFFFFFAIILLQVGGARKGKTKEQTNQKRRHVRRMPLNIYSN